MKNSRKRDVVALRVLHGRLEPADLMSAQRLRSKGFRVGDIVFGDLKKPRNPRFWRLAHGFATLLMENLDEFGRMENAHGVLKRIQWEADIGCDHIAWDGPGGSVINVRLPKSLDFANMDDGEWSEIFRAMCRYVAEKYWPELEPEQVEAMVELVGEVA